MHWINEVEIAKSIDELVASRSITGQPNFPDFDKVANTQIHFRKRQGLSDLSNVRLQNDDVQDFDDADGIKFHCQPVTCLQM